MKEELHPAAFLKTTARDDYKLHSRLGLDFPAVRYDVSALNPLQRDDLIYFVSKVAKKQFPLPNNDLRIAVRRVETATENIAAGKFCLVISGKQEEVDKMKVLINEAGKPKKGMVARLAKIVGFSR